MTATVTNLPGRVDLKVSQGATFEMMFRFKNPPAPAGDGLYIDLTGSIIRAKIRKKYSSATAAAVFTCTLQNQTTDRGRVKLALTDAQTSAITAGESIKDSKSEYVWDCEMVDSAARVTTLCRGKVLIEAEATK